MNWAGKVIAHPAGPNHNTIPKGGAMDKKPVSLKSETNQGVDYKKIAWEIINEPVSEMCIPISRLKTIAELIYGSAAGEEEFKQDRLMGLSHILLDIACDWERLVNEAEYKFPKKEDRP